VTPVIDSRHRLSETSEAFRRIATGHARGKIVVTVDQDGALLET
jgi:NADPH:quinone reductase-like Zn-dependent oxidoreductase